MDVFDRDDPRGSHLTEEDLAKIKQIAYHLAKIVQLVEEPIDPKVIPLLEVAIDILETQYHTRMHFKWKMDAPGATEENVKKAIKEAKQEKKKKPQKPKGPVKDEDDSKDIPSASDLDDWLKGQ
jgi:dihydrodipicolinate reductase